MILLTGTFWFPSAPGADPVPTYQNNTSRRELAYQECGEAIECRLDYHFCSETPSQNPQDTGTEEHPGTGAFQFPFAPRADPVPVSCSDPVPQWYITKYHQERAGLPGVLTHLWVQVRSPILLKFQAQVRPSGHRNQRTAGDRILLVSVCIPELTLCHSSPYSNSSQRELVSQGYWHTGLQEEQATVRDSINS